MSDDHKLSLDDVTDARDKLADALGMQCEVVEYSQAYCCISCCGGGVRVMAAYGLGEGFKAYPRWRIKLADNSSYAGEAESRNLHLAIAEFMGDVRKAAEKYAAAAAKLRMIADGEFDTCMEDDDE